jgi:maleate isomerase/arylmalonate decarboxylase
MRQFALASLDSVLAALVAARSDMTLHGCNSAPRSHGPAFDREFQARIERDAGTVGQALTDLGVRRIGFSSPYVQSLNEGAVEFLRQCGFEVVATAHTDDDLGNYGMGALTPDEVHALGLRADHDDAEAIVLSRTGMRAVEATPMLERDPGKRFVTSNRGPHARGDQTRGAGGRRYADGIWVRVGRGRLGG